MNYFSATFIIQPLTDRHDYQSTVMDEIKEIGLLEGEGYAIDIISRKKRNGRDIVSKDVDRFFSHIMKKR